MISWRIRPGVTGDLEQVLTVERMAAEAPHWPPSVYKRLLSPTVADGVLRRQILVAEGEHGVVGFAVASVAGAAVDSPGCPFKARGELETVVVASEFRRLGLGRALCEAVIDWCKEEGGAEIALEVRSQSAAPIALYRALGFEATGRRPRYYADPEDAALLMHLRLAAI